VQLVDVTDIVSAMRQREDAMKLFTHDVRAPQSAILAALDHRDFETVPAKLRDRIRNNAMRTLTLADGFVRLAQAESADYAFEPIDLFHPLGDAADALWSIAEAAKVKTVLRDPGREFVVEADRGLLSRALINLIDNAIKFSQPGTIVVCALAESTLRGRPAVALTVTDQASGMSQEQQQSMFRRFARTRTTGQDGGGAPVRFDSIGLGLSVVHTVVTRHNGLIDCQSEVGGGTTFTITLPLFDEEPPPSASGTLSSQALGEPPRAL
jgi:signal transduction histidine kinase